MKLISKKIISLLLAYSICAIHAFASVTDSKKRELIDSLIQKSKAACGEYPDSAIKWGTEAYVKSSLSGFQKEKALSLKYIGIAYFTKSDYISTLEKWNESLKIYETISDSNGLSNTFSNIGSVYFNQGEESKALGYFLKALNIAEKQKDTLRIVTLEVNIGTVYLNKKITYEKALYYFKRALKLSIEINDNESAGVIYGNMGELYMKNESIDSALFYLKKSLDTYDKTSSNLPYTLINIGTAFVKKNKLDSAIFYQSMALNAIEKLESTSDLAIVYNALGFSYIQKKDNNNAIDFFKKALMYGQLSENIYSVKESFKGLSEAYYNLNKFDLSVIFKDSLIETSKLLSNLDEQKKLGEMQFDFDINKKENELNILEIEKQLKSKEIQRSKAVRNAFLIGVLFAFIAIIVFVSQKNRLSSEKTRSDNLLLNILPKYVVDEIKMRGSSKARKHRKASILFTDFKNFTTVSESLSAQGLVGLINEYYCAFDQIIEKYELEKIKTIGDSYMCAAGLNNSDEKQHLNLVHAAVEIRNYVKERKNNNPVTNASFAIRIGIHTGEVISGVVGTKKFAYDIWGESVNIASRMESSGAIGEINLSKSTFEEVRHIYECEPRGKIQAKNMENMEMYFLRDKISS